MISISVTRELSSSTRSGVVSVYATTFAQPPYNEGPEHVEHFAQRLDEHSGAAGFRVALASQGEELVGFAYGIALGRDDPWYRAATAPLSPPVRERWLPEPPFMVMELAVRPDRQGGGIGTRLHDALLAGLDHTTALLTALRGATRALSFYERHGWKVLTAELRLDDHPPLVLMGRAL